MNHSQLEQYATGHRELLDALQRIPRSMWHFRPAAGEWTIHEIVVHITDSESNSYIRVRAAIAEPGKRIMAYDEPAWARALCYEQQSPEDALELFRWLRGNTYRLLQMLPDSTWTHSIDHPESGQLTLEQYFQINARHVPDHIAQMQSVYEAWQARGVER